MINKIKIACKNRINSVLFPLFVVLCIIISGLSCVYAQDTQKKESVNYAEIEKQARSVIERATPATVGIRVSKGEGSGVIISPDGLVMTAGHLITRPGEALTFIFPDGKTVKGKSLGKMDILDIGLMQITEKGPWPYVERGDSESIKEGTWCVALGHPLGYKKGRPPVVRVGRLLIDRGKLFQTDCVIVSGDSGGPLLDMQGRLIGIHSRIDENPEMNMHIPEHVFRPFWEDMIAGKVCKLEILRRGDCAGYVSQCPFIPQASRSVVRIQDGGKDVVLGVLINMNLSAEKKDVRILTKLSEIPPHCGELSCLFAHESGIPEAELTNKKDIKNEKSVKGETKKGDERSVPSKNKKKDLQERGPNAVVEHDTGKKCDCERCSCHSADGPVIRIPVEVDLADESMDLAVLKIDTSELTEEQRKALELAAVTFPEKTPELYPGKWLINIGPNSKYPLCLGVISGPVRSIPAFPPKMGTALSQENGKVRVMQVVPDSPAKKAGIQVNDILVKIGDNRACCVKHVMLAMSKYRSGDTVQVTVLRGEKELILPVEVLRMPQLTEAENKQNAMGVGLSKRRDDFPNILVHDSVISPADCCSLLYSMDGQILGMNIARGGRTETYALSSETLSRIIREESLKEEEPAENVQDVISEDAHTDKHVVTEKTEKEEKEEFSEKEGVQETEKISEKSSVKEKESISEKTSEKKKNSETEEPTVK